MRVLHLLLVALSLPAVAEAVTVTINPYGTGDFPTIQAAIDALTDGDTIELTDGTFTGGGNRDIDFRGKGITVRSRSENAEACIIDCEGSLSDPHRGFVFQSGEDYQSSVEGISIVHGFGITEPSLYSGGGMTCESGSSPTISHCIFSNCQAQARGGGFYCGEGCAPTLDNCTFLDNEGLASGGGGGGMAGYNQGCSPTLIRCTFSGNSTTGGGGAYDASYNSSATFEDCVFTDNFGGGGGGGIVTYRAEAIAITRCSFVGNETPNGWGGGVLIYRSGGATITESMFVDNLGSAGGGAFFFAQTTPCDAIVTGSTFAGNNGTYDGGAVDCSGGSVIAHFDGCTMYGNGSPLGSGMVFDMDAVGVLDNTIIAFGTGSPAVVGTSSPPTLTCCDVYGNDGGAGIIASQIGTNGNISEDPLFCLQQHPTLPYTLEDMSPCLPEASGCGLIGAWGLGCGMSSVGDERYEPVHSGLELACSIPNPMQTSGRFAYRLPMDVLGTPVTLRIVDLSGRLVRELIAGSATPGSHSVLWDGRDSGGLPVRGGVYLARLSAGGGTASRPVIVIR